MYNIALFSGVTLFSIFDILCDFFDCLVLVAGDLNG